MSQGKLRILSVLVPSWPDGLGVIMNYDAIVIGAGPAGMMAAIRAAERGRKVLLAERNESPGRKLLISGKGRCNLTNVGHASGRSAVAEDLNPIRSQSHNTLNSPYHLIEDTSNGVNSFLAEFSDSRDFLRNSFARFFNADLMAFFEDAGLKLKTERGGRVFPQSDSSADVLNTLKSKLNNKNVKILYGERVTEILTADKHITGIRTYSGKEFLAPHIAITTGGMSYPQTGSTGDGYKLAESLGHRIVALKPALSAVRIKERFVSDWQGIALKNVRLTLISNNKPVAEQFGEMLFTHFGISGPIVLDLSAAIYDALELKNMGSNNTLPSPSRLSGKVQVAINFKPALDNKILDARLLREFKANSAKGIKNIFKNLMPQGLITRFLEYCRVDGNKDANQITAPERQRLIDGLFGLRLTVESVLPISEAIVTRGGVATKDINPKTMESRIAPGLFFAGEVIDIDAKTGGYNMQAAFSTGWVCGDNI